MYKICSLISFFTIIIIIIGLTLGQSNSSFKNHSPRRSFEKAIFDQSDNNKFYSHPFQSSYQPSSIIESRSSTNHNLSDDLTSNNGNHDGNQISISAIDEKSKLNQEQKSNVQYNHQTNSNNPSQLNQQLQSNVHNQQHASSSSSIHQSSKLQPLTYYSTNNLISSKQNNENSDEHQFNYYELDSSSYHHHQQINNQHTRLHSNQQTVHANYHSTTAAPILPILRLKNTKVDGKLSPTLIITLPKKRKNNGNKSRFPFLKAIVNSFISTDRRTSTPNPTNHDHQQSQQSSNKQTKNHPNTQQQQQQSSNIISKVDQIRIQPIYSSLPSTNNIQQTQLRSQSIVPQTELQQNSNQVQTGNSNVNQNLNSNINPNAGNLNSNDQSNSNVNSSNDQNINSNQPKEESKLANSNEFDDNFQVPSKDELEDDDEEFNEWSEAPRPHNFDENQYYIESNKIKYSSNGHETIKQSNVQSELSDLGQYSNQQQLNGSNQKKPNTLKYSASNQNASPDFESMTSEVIDQEENDNSDKRPSISVRSRGSFLISVLSRMMKSTNFTMITEDMRLGSSSRASCLACHALAALYLSPFYSKDAMVNAARTICISFRLQPARVCLGLIDSFKDDLDYIRTHTKLNRREMCGVIFGLKCSRITTNNLNWMIAIPNRPNMIERRMMKQHNFNLDASESVPMSSDAFSNYTIYHHNGRNSQTSNSKNYNLAAAASSLNSNSLLDIVQITDIHVDPYYVPGSSAECGEPLCCRATSGPVKPGKAAGIWGDYRNCDTPINTLRNTLKQISDSHPNAQYWMWTGDIAPHDIWNITRGEIIYQLRLVSSLMKEYSKVPVFPVIGNHEGVPVNSFPPPEVKGELSVSWLYDEVAKQWSYWLPLEAIKTLRFGGYYMVKVKPGFRIISLNTNYCTRLNPWTLFDPVDPGNQLKWLVKELHSAEMAGDKVHILGHIPPDNRECTQAWLNNFLRIIDRFEHVVLAQYYGHTHRDEWRVLYSPYGRGLRPISIAYIGPSVTPFTENNPAYRVYSMNDKGYIQDHHTYYFNLTEANHGELGIPIWRHEYSATQAYPLKNLGPESWHNLISRFIEDDVLLNKYHKMYFRYSQTRYNQHCLGKCRQALINDLIVAHPLKTKPRRLFNSRKNN